VIESLRKFIMTYERKVRGLNSLTIQSLQNGYEELKVSGDTQSIQTMVDSIILDLLPVLFSSNIIDTFNLKGISQLFFFEFKKIEKDKIYEQLLTKMNGFLGHCDPSFGVPERES
jgi:hypothetical protein